MRLTTWPFPETGRGEIRRRLSATILEMNVQASLDAGVPTTLSLDDFDTDLRRTLVMGHRRLHKESSSSTQYDSNGCVFTSVFMFSAYVQGWK